MILKLGFYRVSEGLAANANTDQYFTVELGFFVCLFPESFVCCLWGFVFNHMAKVCNISVEIRVSTDKDW